MEKKEKDWIHTYIRPKDKESLQLLAFIEKRSLIDQLGTVINFYFETNGKK